METAAFGATPEGGTDRLTVDRGPPGPRLVPGACRRWAARSPSTHGRDVRAARARRDGRRWRSARISTPSRPAASSTACSACSPALEAMRTLNEAGYETDAPIEVVNWTNEEGSRFAPAMVASAAIAGDFTTDDWACAQAIAPASRSARRSMRSAIAATERCGAHQLSALLRAAHRAGPDPGGRGQDHRRGHRRAGRCLVRGHDHRLRERMPAPRRCRCASNALLGLRGDRARDRADRARRMRPPPSRPSARRIGRAELAQRRAGRGALHPRPARTRTAPSSTRSRRRFARALSEICGPREAVDSTSRGSGASRRCRLMPGCVAAVDARPKAWAIPPPHRLGRRARRLQPRAPGARPR